MDKETKRVEDVRVEDLETKRGRTDILGRLQTILEKESKFPLSGVMLFSDGRHLEGGTIEALVREYSQKNIPIFTGQVGSRREPVDLAILEVVSPPFAVTGTESRIQVRVKTSLEEPRDVQFSIKRGGKTIKTFERKVGNSPVRTVELPFSPGKPGVFRYTVNVKSPGGEAFPSRNNSMDFAMHVREEKVKVLFLDWKPRWESRFALNVFRRLNYVELNSIIAVVQEDGTVKRGVRKGTWPDSMATLEMYDLVLIGSRTGTILEKQEWNDLSSYVKEKGGTIAFMKSNAYRSTSRYPVLPEEMKEPFFPLKKGAGSERETNFDWRSPSGLQISDAGVYHPSTRKLTNSLARGKTKSEMLSRNAFSLVQLANDRAPLLATRHAGKGKVFMIGNENLWKPLNPEALGGHAQMYVGLINWAMEGGSVAVPDEKSPSIVLNQRTGRQRRGLQVWVKNAPDQSTVEAVSDGDVVASARVRSTQSGRKIQRALFDPVPAKNLSFRLKGQPDVTSSEVVVTSRYEELSRLALNESLMTKLASKTKGISRSFAQFKQFLSGVKPKKRVESEEQVWQLWDMPLILLFLAVMLTVEWVWRKFVGLI